MTTLAATDQSRSVAATLGTAINSVTQRWRFERSRLVVRWETDSRDAMLTSNGVDALAMLEVEKPRLSSHIT